MHPMGGRFATPQLIAYNRRPICGDLFVSSPPLGAAFRMIVLAIHDGHDAGACLLRDGKIVLHSSEERRRNIKNLAGFPTESVQQLFKRSGIDPKDVDLITVCGKLRTVAPTREEKWFHPYLRVAI